MRNAQFFDYNRIMRSIWRGSISFGLVNIPIRLYTATNEKALNFDYLHKTDFSKVRYAKVCEREEKEIAYQDIVRGYEVSDGKYIAITDQDLKTAQTERSKMLTILSFAQESEIDTMYFDKPYYLEPDKNAEKAYALFYKALKDSKKVGVSKLVLRMREHLCIIKAEEKALILNQLRFAREVRDSDELNVPKVELSPQEVKMAETLVDQLTKPFNINDYEDSYTDVLKKLIQAKAKGVPIKPLVKKEEPSKTADLMELLQKSISAS